MNEKPILFSTPMVRAILDNRKSQTRRVVKPPKWAYTDKSDDLKICYSEICAVDGKTGAYKLVKPKYQPGDILWVRETWCPYDDDHIIDGVKYAYKADATPNSEDARKAYGYKWNPSIHMPPGSRPDIPSGYGGKGRTGTGDKHWGYKTRRNSLIRTFFKFRISSGEQRIS